jgi:hypothetical protein
MFRIVSPGEPVCETFPTLTNQKSGDYRSSNRDLARPLGTRKLNSEWQWWTCEDPEHHLNSRIQSFECAIVQGLLTYKHQVAVADSWQSTGDVVGGNLTRCGERTAAKALNHVGGGGSRPSKSDDFQLFLLI